MSKEHSHAGSTVDIKVTQARQSMKEHAVLSKETPGQIYASHVANTTDEVKIALGKKDTIKCAIHYTQRGQVPSEPLTVKEFKI